MLVRQIRDKARIGSAGSAAQSMFQMADDELARNRDRTTNEAMRPNRGHRKRRSDSD